MTALHWPSYQEIRERLRQYFVFAAAGIDDLVPYGDGRPEPDPDARYCPECGWLWLDDAVRCEGCNYPDPIVDDADEGDDDAEGN